MLWADFYEGFWDWADATKCINIASLEDIGTGGEIVEVIYETEDPETLFERKNVVPQQLFSHL